MRGADCLLRMVWFLVFYIMSYICQESFLEQAVQQFDQQLRHWITSLQSPEQRSDLLQFYRLYIDSNHYTINTVSYTYPVYPLLPAQIANLLSQLLDKPDYLLSQLLADVKSRRLLLAILLPYLRTI
jgi:hypothetical protein